MPTHGGVKTYDPDSPDDVYYQGNGSGSSDSGSGFDWGGFITSIVGAAGATYSSIYAADAAAQAERERAELDLQSRIASINAQGKWILPASGLVLVLIIWLIVVATKRRKRK